MRWSGLNRVAVAAALLLFTAASQAEAQREETLLGRRGGTSYGGFGGPVVKIGRIAGEDAVFSGGRGGLIINHKFVIGFGGYSLARENVRTGFAFSNGDEPALGLEYGGLEFEYIFRPSRVAHITAYALLGGGEATYETRREVNGATSTQRLASEVFVLEPAVNAEVNITSWFRMGLGAGYRYVDGSDLPRANDGALSGAVGTLTFKFGSF
jgi:hypothetical protein